ncbi:hypothetical protein AYI68_g5624 [Smittium mucronatum]|uniref:Uncharacterized protein n=1 Tax=Smittium mucronatum TaxID=133383 RepID=A0A1R0GTR3_9FUNG|nr:hypothetical protein AYI68_g5624 [Smittium mucronatum]
MNKNTIKKFKKKLKFFEKISYSTPLRRSNNSVPTGHWFKYKTYKMNILDNDFISLKKILRSELYYEKDIDKLRIFLPKKI